MAEPEAPKPAAAGPEIKILESKAVGSGKTGGGGEHGKKQRLELIVLGVLVPVFLLLVVSTFFGKKKNVESKPASSIKPATTVTTPVSTLPQPSGTTVAPAAPGGSTPEASKEENSWGFNPFSQRSERVSDEAPQALVLQGVVTDPSGNSYAVINQRIVKEGDLLDDNKIKEIKDGTVVVETSEGVELTLRN